MKPIYECQRGIGELAGCGRTRGLRPSVAVGVVTILLIIALEKTRLKALGMVAAIILGSTLAVAFNWFDVVDIELLNDITDVPRSIPRPQLPLLGVVPQLIVPALSLAFVGLVQGAGISANFTNPDGSYPDASRDFSGQGIANMAAGIFQGMPVGGSMSASSLTRRQGRSRGCRCSLPPWSWPSSSCCSPGWSATSPCWRWPGC